MNRLDHRGCTVSGAEPAALEAFERALAAYQGWRDGAEAPLALALQEAPGFVMAHVLQAYLLVCSRDPRRVAMARPTLARAAALPANERERLHVAAIAALLDDDDFDAARATLGELLRLEPRDALALQAAHSLDYVSGDVGGMNERVAAVLPAWSSDLPGYHAVLAMHAFGLEESGRYDEAEANARAALALDPLDARAHHVMAHVFEMTDRAEAGERWLADHAEGWANDTVVATHCWWHRGLFQLELGRPERALDIYHHHVRAGCSDAVADLIDASALLWRIELAGCDTGGRWLELADAWAPHIDDALLQLQRPARDARLRRRTRLAARRPARARPANRALAADPPRQDDATARPGRVPRPGRVRPRRRHARDHAARQPAGAGAPPRRQPRAARRPPPDDAARGRAAARGEGVVEGDRVGGRRSRSLPEQ